MPQVKIIEQAIFYFTHEEVEELLYEAGVRQRPNPHLQREKKEEKDAKG